MKVDSVGKKNYNSGEKINLSQSSKKEYQKRVDLKKNLSTDDIRTKVKEHFGGHKITGDPAKHDPEKISNIVSKNDPRKPETIKKLRKALDDGVIDFSLREREILEKIIK